MPNHSYHANTPFIYIILQNIPDPVKYSACDIDFYNCV